MKTIITDWGQALQMIDAQGREAGAIPRYGVWVWASGHKPQCVDTGDDLETLRRSMAASWRWCRWPGHDRLARADARARAAGS